MSVEIGTNNRDIVMTRGDSATMRMPLFMDGIEYALKEGDIVRFAVRDATDEETDPLLVKTLTDYILQLDPSDTKGLPIGVYRYDVQITFAESGRVLTYIPDKPKDKAKFQVTWEAY